MPIQFRQYRPQYPATSTYVIAVGGTSASIKTDVTLVGESLWSDPASGTGSGSGTILFQAAPAWQ